MTLKRRLTHVPGPQCHPSARSVPLTINKIAIFYRPMSRRPKQLSFTDHRMRTGRGGPRPGAGRPRGPRPRVWHRRREKIPGHCPVHVTLRVREGIPSLRGGALVHEWRRSLAEASERGRLPRDALLAPGRPCASDRRSEGKGGARDRHEEHRGASGACRESGLRPDRPRARRALPPPPAAHSPRGSPRAGLRPAQRAPSPREAPRGRARGHSAHLDGASSARWFDGWRPQVANRLQEARGSPEVARPRTWLLRIGWRRHGLVDPAEVPGVHVPA